MEYSVVWTPKNNSYTIEASQVGQREIYFNEELKIANIDFCPAFKANGVSYCNRLEIKYQNDREGIIDLKNDFEDFSFCSQNDMLKFGFKKFTNRNGHKIDALVTEVYLIDEVLQNAKNLTSFTIS